MRRCVNCKSPAGTGRAFIIQELIPYENGAFHDAARGALHSDAREGEFPFFYDDLGDHGHDAAGMSDAHGAPYLAADFLDDGSFYRSGYSNSGS